MVPRAVLMRTGLKTVKNAKPLSTARSVNTVRPVSTARFVNTVRPYNTAHPKPTVSCARPKTHFQNQAQRPFYKNTTLTKRSNIQNINTARQAVNTVRPKVNTVRAKGFNAVKPSACWVWRPIKPNGASSTPKILKNLMEVMLLYASYFEDDSLKSVDDAQLQDQDGTYDDCGFQDDGIDDHQVNTASPQVNTGSRVIRCLTNGVTKRTLILIVLFVSQNVKLPDEKAVSTACYVQNRVLVVKPHNKTPYELFRGIKPAIGFMKPFGCHVTILNTLDKLGKFDGQSDEGFFVGYSLSSKAFRVYNIRTRKVQENLHVGFLENNLCYKEIVDDAQSQIKMGGSYDCSFQDDGIDDHQVNTASPQVNTGSRVISTAAPEVNTATSEGLMGPIPTTEDTQVEDQEIELGNLSPSYEVSSTPHTRIHKDHPIDHVIGNVQSSVLNKKDDTSYSELDFLVLIYKGKTHQDLHTCLLPVSYLKKNQREFLKLLICLRVIGLLVQSGSTEQEDGGNVVRNKARLVAQGHTQEEGLIMLEGICSVARNRGYKNISGDAFYMGFQSTKWMFKSAFLMVKFEKEVYVCQPPEAWYDTLATYLLSNGFQRGKIDQTLFIKSQKGHILLVQIYVDDIIFGSTKKELCEEFEKLMKDKFQMSSMGELTFFLGLQVQQRKKGIFISQDKYVHEILKKFNYTDVKSASTPTDLERPLVKDADADDVDEHLYRSMIGSLMYLTASRPDIMFAVCACARFQVSPKTSHLLAVKRIFRYLKGKPSLGLWYSKDSPLELVAYTDSDYAGATLDRKSTTGGCQFLGNRLISWQCKKQTVVATSTTEAEYVAAASCCGQVLWIQNQLLDYGYNFMNTVIYIDNTSTICIIENPVQHSKTKHIEIRHHFIRDCNTKKLIQMAKIDTQLNVADLLTKGFDAGRFQYLVSSIGMLNP
ncbi:putative ribonuclease H-like domain-containing protein [Tanacetum coccineum]